MQWKDFRIHKPKTDEEVFLMYSFDEEKWDPVIHIAKCQIPWDSMPHKYNQCFYTYTTDGLIDMEGGQAIFPKHTCEIDPSEVIFWMYVKDLFMKPEKFIYDMKETALENDTAAAISPLPSCTHKSAMSYLCQFSHLLTKVSANAMIKSE